MKTSVVSVGTACALLLLISVPTRAAQVDETEAVAIAEWWYAREISAATTALPESEKAARLASRTRHQLHYVLGRDRLQRGGKTQTPALAYIVTFEPSGFVVEDRKSVV